MNFFEHQESARRNSNRLVFFFFVALFLIVLAVNLVVSFLLFSSFEAEYRPENLVFLLQAHGIVTLVTLLLVGGASCYRMAQLKSGGDVVAQSIGGTWVDPETRDASLRRLCNVVEEISIASGVPTPHIYVLESEEGINAFAAGYTTEDAAVAVSQGALDQLTRDELQGVIAHEFTHILNGDMRLNIRMMGVLYGILVISIVGRIFLHTGSRRSNDKENGGRYALGIALLLIGFIGVFFGRLIKAGVSRQREFLADAHAVQFTRNPDGIGGALKKIGGLTAGSNLNVAAKEEVSHMLFASGQNFLTSMLATHPPLAQRIRAIDPSFQPEAFKEASMGRESGSAASGKPNPWDFLKGEEETAQASDFSGKPNPWDFLRENKQARVEISTFREAVMQDVKMPSPEHLDQATQIMTVIPDLLLQAARSRSDVLALFPALLLGRTLDLREEQLDLVQKMLGAKIVPKVEVLSAEVEKLPPLLTLALTDLALSALRQADPANLSRLSRLLVAMVTLDGKVTVFEFCLVRLLKYRIEDVDKPTARLKSRKPKKSEVREALVQVFSVLAWQGHTSETLANQAFLVGIRRMLPMDIPVYVPPLDWVKDLDTALGVLDRLDFSTKGELVQALLATAASDGTLSLEEAELLRMICACLHIPAPPVLPQISAVNGTKKNEH